MQIPGEILRVESLDIQDDGSILVTSYKFDANVLAWNAPDNEVVPVKNVYNNDLAQATNLSFTTVNPNLSLAGGYLTWDASNDNLVTGYIVYVTDVPIGAVDENTSWTELGRTSSLSFNIPSLYTGEYTLAVCAYSLYKRAPKFGTLS